MTVLRMERSGMPEDHRYSEAQKEQDKFITRIDKIETELDQAAHADDAEYSAHAISDLANRLGAFHERILSMDDPEEFLEVQALLEPELQAFKEEVKHVHIHELLREAQTLRGRLKTFTDAVPASSMDTRSLADAEQRLNEFDLLLKNYIDGSSQRNVADLEDTMQTIRNLFDYIPRS